MSGPPGDRPKPEGSPDASRSKDDVRRAIQETTQSPIPSFPGDDRACQDAATRLTEIPGLGPSDAVEESFTVAGYELREKIGEGGMGVVYKAVQTSLNRVVALKALNSLTRGDSEFVRRFKREAIAGAKLNHPNIVGVYDHGVEHGTVYLVLEFVEGRDCSDLVRDNGPFDQKAAAEIIRDAVLGLSHAHAADIIHRDIKPANIMVVSRGLDDARGSVTLHAKIADFGIARIRERLNPELPELTQPGMFMGTPEYMALEQAGSETDFRADIYSLGSTFYFLLTGQPPFTGGSAIDILQKKMASDPPDPRKLVPAIDPGISKIVSRMTRRKPEDRYQSYGDLLADLETVLDRISPGRSTGSRPRLRAESRSWTIAVAALVLAVALVAGFVWWRNGRSGGGGEAEAARLLSSLRSQPAAVLVADLPKHRTELDAILAELTPETRAPHEASFTELATSALGASLGDRLTRLGALYRAAKWAEYGVVAQDACRPYEELALELPAELAKHLEQARAALNNDAGEAERKALREADAALASKRPADAQRLLRDFESLYPFSPDVARVQELRSTAARRLRVADSFAELARLQALEPSAFVDELARTRVALLAGFQEIAAADRERLEAALDEAIVAKVTAFELDRRRALAELWQGRDYAAMTTVAQEAESRLRALGREPSDELIAFRQRGEQATESGRGAAEKARWEAIVAAPDPVRELELLTGFETEFPFSPSLAEATTRRLAAAKKAPTLVLRVDPPDATVTLDGASVSVPFGAPRRLGSVRVQATAAGFFPLDTVIQHDGSAPAELMMMAEPARRLTSPAGTAVDQMLRIRDWIRPPDSGGGGFAPRAGGLEIEGSSEVWHVRSRDVVVAGDAISNRLFPGAPGWRLTLVVTCRVGEAEVRVLHGSGDRCAVVGVDAKGLYVGMREGPRLTIRHRAPLTDGTAELGLEWHGDVLLVGDRIGKKTFGSVRVDWAPAPAQRIEFAARSGKSTFADPALEPLR